MEDTMTGDIEKKKVFTVRQVLSLMGATAFIVFIVTGIWWRFQSMEIEMSVLKAEHEAEIKTLKAEGTLGFTMMQKAIDSMSDRIDDKYETIGTRVNTIRDRQNDRLDKLEQSGSDSKNN